MSEHGTIEVSPEKVEAAVRALREIGEVRAAERVEAEAQANEALRALPALPDLGPPSALRVMLDSALADLDTTEETAAFLADEGRGEEAAELRRYLPRHRERIVALALLWWQASER